MINNFLENVRIGKFKEAKACFKDMPFEQMHNTLIDLGFKTEFVPLYTFLNFLLMEKETAELHYCAAMLIAQCFVYIEGSYSMGLFHARRSVELAPGDSSYKEYLLLYYSIPDKLLSLEEAIVVAKELEVQDPGNVAANHFFQDIKGGVPDYLKK